MKRLLILALLAGSFASAQAQTDWTKGLLVEHFTGSWCGICTDGYALMATALAGHNHIEEVFLHNGDPMANPDVDAVAMTYASGLPTAMGDRMLYPSQGIVAIDRQDYHLLPQRLNDPARVAVYGHNIYDPVTRQLSVTVEGLFREHIEADLRFNCYVIEDSVIGTSAAYHQANGDNNIPSSPYFNLGDPIVGFVHRNVVRDMLGGPWGTDQVIADTVQAWEHFSTTYSTTLNPNWDVDQVKLVFVVQQYHLNPNKREILNIVPLQLNEQVGAPVSVEHLQSDENTLTLQPIRANETTWLQVTHASGPLHIQLYSLTGQLVESRYKSANPEGSLLFQLSPSPQARGWYIARVNDGTTVRQAKFWRD